MAMPTFSLLPAAKAGQFAPWPVEYVTSYAGVTPILAALADAIENAEIVTG
jgi:iron complex transport system substrate-binding protein